LEFPDLQFGVRCAEIGGGVYVVGIRGELDGHNAPELDRELGDLLDRSAARVIVDLAGVTFIDSAGLGVLAGAATALRAQDGRLELAAAGPHTAKVLRIAGLDRIVAVHRTLGDAFAEAPAERAV
jgi:anti-sigma B factor antagonist